MFSALIYGMMTLFCLQLKVSEAVPQRGSVWL